MKLNEDFLPDFITMTNYCEDNGYTIIQDRQKQGILCNVFFNGKEVHKGKKYFKDCLIAQKESYSQLYKVIVNNL